MKNLITIGLPSKGRLRDGSIDFLKKNDFKISSNGKERNYFAQIENFPNILGLKNTLTEPPCPSTIHYTPQPCP